jgi:putative ABC transport system substrate-binding protein
VLDVRRREFITLLGGAAAAWPLAARAQQPAMPVVGFFYSGTLPGGPQVVTAFRQGLKEAGFIEGQNVAIEFHSGVNQSRSPVLVTDLLRRQVALIVGNTPAALAAKAATTTVPIVFAATRSGMASSPTSTGPVATSPV